MKNRTDGAVTVGDTCACPNIELPYDKVIYKGFKVFHLFSLEDDIMILLMVDALNIFN